MTNKMFIKRTNRIWKFQAAAIIIILLCSQFTGCTNKQDSLSNETYGQENAIWTESIYLRGFKPSTGKELSIRDLKKYARTLRKYNIKYAYLFAGPYENDGHLPAYPFEDLARNSVQKLRRYYPEIRILPWIGGVQNRTVYLGDSLWVRNALADTKKMVEFLDVDGVHVDFEYILKGDPYLDTTIDPEKPHDKKMYARNVNAFHKELRNLLPDSFISSVVASNAPDIKPWKRKTSMVELDELCRYVDQISFLYYDTSIESQNVFRENCVTQLRSIQSLRSKHENTQFLLGIGTFVNRAELQKYRNLEIENIPNTIEVIKESIFLINSSERIIDGISIFCDWETDRQEWKDFYKHWGKN